MPAEQTDPSKKSLIFVSHSSKDKLIADAICARLENQGIRCWIAPRDVNPGRDYSDQIEEALEKSSVFVTVISSGSNSSRHVKSEIDRAFSLGHIIVPFRVENIELDKGLAYYLSKTHWLDAVTPPMEQHIDRLATIIRKLSDQGSVPPPVPAAQSTPPRPIPLPAPNNRLLILALGLAGIFAMVCVFGFIFLASRRENSVASPISPAAPAVSVAPSVPVASIAPPVSTAPAAATVAPSKSAIEGAWTIAEGRTLEGTSFDGTVRFFQDRDRYQVAWQTAAGNYSGVGLVRGNKLCVGWSERSFGVVFYKIGGDGTLNGTWVVTGAAADQTDGTEKALGGAPGKIEGDYSIIGSNPGAQDRYEGKLKIRRTGETYRMQWNVNDSITTGVAIRIDDDLFAAFGEKDQVFGVVGYTFDGPHAKGVWTLGGASQTGTENLIRQ